MIPHIAHRLLVFIEANASIIPIGENNKGYNTGIPCHGIAIIPVKKLIINIAVIIGKANENMTAAFLKFILK